MRRGAKVTVIGTRRTPFGPAELVIRRGYARLVHMGILEYAFFEDEAEKMRKVGTVPMHAHGVQWCRGWDGPEVGAMLAARAL